MPAALDGAQPIRSLVLRADKRLLLWALRAALARELCRRDETAADAAAVSTLACALLPGRHLCGDAHCLYAQRLQPIQAAGAAATSRACVSRGQPAMGDRAG